jgi:16S rRNA (guanine966-N2)-methyltransferase
VIGGSSRGRRIEAPHLTGLRPTSDRVREAIFDVLGSRGGVEALDVADLFAGSGALGIEALSRGARHVTFVEWDRRAAAAIERNIASAGLTDSDYVIARRDVVEWCNSARRSFDVALIDPPYSYGSWSELLQVVPARVLVLESADPPPVCLPFESLRTYRYGTTVVTLARAPGTETNDDTNETKEMA